MTGYTVKLALMIPTLAKGKQMKVDVYRHNTSSRIFLLVPHGNDMASVSPKPLSIGDFKMPKWKTVKTRNEQGTIRGGIGVNFADVEQGIMTDGYYIPKYA